MTLYAWSLVALTLLPLAGAVAGFAKSEWDHRRALGHPALWELPPGRLRRFACGILGHQAGPIYSGGWIEGRDLRCRCCGSDLS